jgi:hypothetical protein
MKNNFNWDDDDDDEIEEKDNKKTKKFKGITMEVLEEGRKFLFQSSMKCYDPNCEKCKKKKK